MAQYVARASGVCVIVFSLNEVTICAYIQSIDSLDSEREVQKAGLLFAAANKIMLIYITKTTIFNV